MKIIRVIYSPFSDDTDLPWTYTEDDFVKWCDEVFCEGYKLTTPILTFDECISMVEQFGFKLEISEQ